MIVWYEVHTNGLMGWEGGLMAFAIHSITIAFRRLDNQNFEKNVY